MTPEQKKLAAMYGNPNKITRGDIITAAKKIKVVKKNTTTDNVSLLCMVAQLENL